MSGSEFWRGGPLPRVSAHNDFTLYGSHRVRRRHRRETYLEGRAGAYAIAGASASMRHKTGFAFNHLQVAVNCARDAHEIEQANIAKPFGPWSEE